jgi:Cu(I)/Ag(I) efflux system membrane protein CusA/SilA
VIDRVKARMGEIASGLPRKTLADGTVSQVQLTPFYDRTVLIEETLGTLKDALVEQVLITTFVVLMFLRHLRSCVVFSLTMPLAILACFILMKLFHVDSNLMSLGGIAIAIGTLVDMGIILTENIVRHIEEDQGTKPLKTIILEASNEIGSAVTTAILMTVIAFLPVFALTGPEGKLFRPLAYTKSFVLLGALFVAVLILPTLAHIFFAPSGKGRGVRAWLMPGAFIVAGVVFAVFGWYWAGVAAAMYGVFALLDARLPTRVRSWTAGIAGIAVMGFVLIVLTRHWMPLGEGAGFTRNLIIVLALNLVWASVRVVFIDFYPYLLRIFLDHKIAFLSLPLAVVIMGLVVWLGFDRTFSWLPRPRTADDTGALSRTYREAWSDAVHIFPGLGREFMPPLDEGSFLFMPSLMPHAGLGAALQVISEQDHAIRGIPEVAGVLGKIGRAETALDPAPLGMVETIILYKPEYSHDPLTGQAVVDSNGMPIRNWRPHIKSAQDIWNEVTRAAETPGVTGAPYLQPIAARLVMLQSGMRAPMGVKVFGKSLDEIEQVGYAIAEILKDVPGVEPSSVIPDRVVGKPYLEIEIDRARIARYGVNIRDVQDVIEIALGGVPATMTVEGRERYAIRARYLRELRDTPDSLERITVSGMSGVQVPLAQLATIQYVRGPQEIKTEDNFLVSYVLFDKRPGYAEVDVVEHAERLLAHNLENGQLKVPAGTHYKFAGGYENQVRFARRLSVVLPVSLFLLFMLLYFEFRSVPISLIVFTGIPVAWAGGFIGLWLIAQPWFCDFAVFGVNVRDLLHFRQYNLSAAVWVGFIALFSVTTDDGVVLASYLGQEFDRRRIRGIADIRAAIIAAGTRRVRPCLMTSATTVLSLLPVLTSNGRGADVMIPIALPAIGGLSIELLSLYVLPVCYCLYKECLWRLGRRTQQFPAAVEAATALG